MENTQTISLEFYTIPIDGGIYNGNKAGLTDFQNFWRNFKSNCQMNFKINMLKNSQRNFRKKNLKVFHLRRFFQAAFKEFLKGVAEETN